MNQEILKQKEAVVSEVTDLVKNSQAVVVCEYRGLTVAQITSLRKELREKNAKANIFKNSLVRRAFDSLEHKDADELVVGPNIYIFMDDYSNGSLKAVAKFAKRNDNFKIKGGVIEGKVMTAEEIITLAKLPSKETLLSMLAGALLANISKFAVALDQVRIQKEENSATESTAEAEA